MALLTFAVTAIATAFSAGTASAEILAMMNYESKPAEDLKSLKLSGAVARREGIAIVDVDSESESFGKWLADITPKVGALGDAGAIAENSYLALEPENDDAMVQLPGCSITYRIALGLQQGQSNSLCKHCGDS